MVFSKNQNDAKNAPVTVDFIPELSAVSLEIESHADTVC